MKKILKQIIERIWSERSALFRFWLSGFVICTTYLALIDAPVRRSLRKDLKEVTLIAQDIGAVEQEIRIRRTRFIEIVKSFAETRKQIELQLALNGKEEKGVGTDTVLKLINDLQWLQIELVDFNDILKKLQTTLCSHTFLVEANTKTPKSQNMERNTIHRMQLPSDCIARLGNLLDKIQQDITHRKLDTADFSQWLNDTYKFLFMDVLHRFSNYTSTAEHNMGVVKQIEQDKIATLDVLNTIRDAALSVIVALITLSVAVFQSNKEIAPKLPKG